LGGYVKKTIGIVVVLAVALVASAGCKKSVKGEESRWKRANQQAGEMAALYPGFKTAIDERRTAASKIHDAAQKLDDEKAKIAKLAEANELLDRGFIDQLGKVDEQLKKLQAAIVDAKGAEVEGAGKARADEAIAQVKRTLSGVEATLKKGAPNAVAAQAVMNKVDKDLTAARALLAKAAPTVAPPQAVADPAAADPPEPQPWTCEYCDHANDPEATTCTNCGAARPSAK
jgi:hypothetical protein